MSKLLMKLVGREGIEPSTNGLRVRCSTSGANDPGIDAVSDAVASARKAPSTVEELYARVLRAGNAGGRRRRRNLFKSTRALAGCAREEAG